MRPLTGIRAVSIALNVPGPLAVSHLAAQGATVTKIEPPDGDPLAGFCPTLYADLHRAVTVERCDLKSAEGRAHAIGRLSAADVFITSQRPAALARLGLDTATLLAPDARTAHLRCLNIVGEVARPEVAGHDLTYLARAGLLGGELPRTLIADVIGAERAYATVLLLLRQPPGAHLVMGLFDALSPLAAIYTHGLTRPGGLLGGLLPAYGVYETQEGRVAIAALEPHFRRRLYAALSLADGGDLTEVMRTRTAAEWEAWALERDLPMHRVVT
ncbi:MAG: CoA transferase [Acidobacteriota bacterium]